MIEYMKPMATVKNMQRLIDGDLKHIGEALLAGRTVICGGTPVVKGYYSEPVSEYSVLANDPLVLISALHPEVTLKNMQRLIDGDLAHIGAEIIAGKEMIQAVTKMVAVNDHLFNFKADFYL